MKKSLLLSVAAFLACGFAQAEIVVTPTNIDQPENDTLLFALPVNVDIYQDIQNYPEDDPNSRLMKFQPEYIVTAQDFTRGDTNKGTATLPANAKVIGLGLDGYDVASDMTSHGIYLEVTAWCYNIPREKTSFEPGFFGDGTDLFDGWRTRPPRGQLLIDTINYRGYYNYPGYITTFDSEASAENPATIVEIPFNVPDENGNNTPFVYTGENIYLTLWMNNWSDVHMKYRYMAFDEAEGEMASLMRSGNYCFNSDTYEMIYQYFGVNLMYELPKHRLPAFRTPYYTNDVFVTVTGFATEYELKDEDGNVMTRDADGNYYSLDHTKTYTVYSNGKARGSFNFEDITKDINLEINNTTSIEDVNADKAVANVEYYNLAGQLSAEPMEGVNIVVTTYSDGTRTTAKVIK